MSAYHWKGGVHFERLPDGSVSIRIDMGDKYFDVGTIPASEWASIVHAVAAPGADFYKIHHLHGGRPRAEPAGESVRDLPTTNEVFREAWDALPDDDARWDYHLRVLAAFAEDAVEAERAALAPGRSEPLECPLCRRGLPCEESDRLRDAPAAPAASEGERAYREGFVDGTAIGGEVAFEQVEQQVKNAVAVLEDTTLPYATRVNRAWTALTSPPASGEPQP